MKEKYNERRLDVVEAFKDRLNFYKNKEKYKILIPRAYVLYMKMIITNYMLSKENKMDKISRKMLNKYKEEYDTSIKIENIKDKILLKTFLYWPNLYYIAKRGVQNVRKNT